MIHINTRSLKKKFNGINTYTEQIVSRIPQTNLLTPKSNLNPLESILWEQIILPTQINKNDLLWSPSNTGPIWHHNQVITIHDLSTFDYSVDFSKRFTQYYKFLLPRIAKNSSGIITVSNFSKSRIIKLLKIPENKIHVTHLGIDKSTFKIYSENFYDQYKIKNSLPELFFLYVGTVSKRKNINYLIDSFKIFNNKSRKKVSLVICGNLGSKSVFSEQKIKIINDDNIIFINNVSQDSLPLLLGSAYAFIYPSKYEGFGLPPLEAMACGTPVIASNATSLPEILEDAPLYIDPNNTASLTEALLNLANNPSTIKELKNKSILHSKKFDWQITADRTYNILKEYE